LTTVLLIIHLFVTLALIGVVLIQRSEGGGLGVGTGQGMGSFMSGRGTANLLTRATAILATIFMVLSLTLALMNRGTNGIGSSILDAPASTPVTIPSGTPAPPSPAGASAPATPGSASPGAAPSSGTAPATGAAPGSAAKPASPTPPSGSPAQGPAQGPSVPTN
jgi:preprotein translocase subunit SecG